jgi:hypothetical protein
MNSNNELTRNDIYIEPDNVEISFDNGNEISFYIQSWFDVDKKFNLNILNEDDTWLDMNGWYNPYEDKLRIECIIDSPDSTKSFNYEPTENEAKLIKDLLTEAIKNRYNQTPAEFCEDDCETELEIGGM